MSIMIEAIVDRHNKDIRELLQKILGVANNPNINKQQVIVLLERAIKIYE